MSHPEVVVVGGCGRVGLPLSLALADRGVHVAACDTDVARVRQVSHGVMPFREDGADECLARTLRAGMLTATVSHDVISTARTVILITGTSGESIIPFLRDDQLVIIRSTIGPGGFSDFEKLAAPLRLDLAFCPERLAEGHALEEISHLPQIIAARTEAAERRASGVFRRLGCQLITLTPEEAELAKLFTNTWRYVLFATANEFSGICAEQGLSFDRIRHALTLGYPRAAGLPRAQFAGGPCLPKDAKLLGGEMATAARNVNQLQPAMLAARLADQHDLTSMTVGILGMTFKPGSDDMRGSLAPVLREELEKRGATVLCTDPYLPELPSLAEVAGASDLLIIATSHPEYGNIRGAIRAGAA